MKALRSFERPLPTLPTTRHIMCCILDTSLHPNTILMYTIMYDVSFHVEELCMCHTSNTRSHFIERNMSLWLSKLTNCKNGKKLLAANWRNALSS
jgi:hypothetical protein